MLHTSKAWGGEENFKLFFGGSLVRDLGDETAKSDQKDRKRIPIKRKSRSKYRRCLPAAGERHLQF